MEAMKKKTGAVDEKRETNFLETTTRSPEKAYYEFLLRKEKLLKIKEKGIAEQWLTQDEADALETVSDKEKLELKILARLYQLADTSADYLQVKSITGCDSREEVASKLADIYYKKYVVDDIITRFVAPANVKEKILVSSAKKSREAYDAFGNA
jgi:hypothetical protein